MVRISTPFAVAVFTWLTFTFSGILNLLMNLPLTLSMPCHFAYTFIFTSTLLTSRYHYPPKFIYQITNPSSAWFHNVLFPQQFSLASLLSKHTKKHRSLQTSRPLDKHLLSILLLTCGNPLRASCFLNLRSESGHEERGGENWGGSGAPDQQREESRTEGGDRLIVRSKRDR